MQPQATQTPPAPAPPAAPTPGPGPGTPPPAPTPPPAVSDKKGYGKRPMWQWILIYVVLAIIVYGIVYFVWIKGGSSGTTGSGY